MNAHLLKQTEEWLAKALQADLNVDEFKVVTQLLAVLSKDAGSSEAPSFSPEKCREGLRVMLGKETQ